MKKILLVAAILLYAATHVFSQSLAINTDGSVANAGAMLDIKSTTKGLLIPRMTTIQRTGIGTPPAGLQVYDTDLNLLYFYNGSSWSGLSASTNFWTFSGGNIYNNTGINVGIGTTTPAAKLHVGAGTRFTLADVGSLFMQSGSGVGSARDWKIYVPMPLGYLAFRDMGFDNLNNGMATDAMAIQYNTGNVGIGTTNPGDKLEVNGNIRLTNTGTLLAAPSTTGNAYSVTVRAGDPYVPVGGSGGSVNITATNNMPAGGSGYSNLGPSGNVNITSGSGYNTGGGHVNIIAGQTSCWAQTSNSHSDVNIQGGANLVAADAASINVYGGGTVGVGCPTANANGGHLILRSGIGTGTGAQGNIQLLNGNVGIGTAALSSKLEVNGYSKLGSGATVPAIQMKKLTGTSAASAGAIVSIPHALNWTKILAVDVLLDNGASTIPPRYDNPAVDYSFYVTSTDIVIYNGVSMTSFNRPVRILITYEQ